LFVIPRLDRGIQKRAWSRIKCGMTEKL